VHTWPTPCNSVRCALMTDDRLPTAALSREVLAIGGCVRRSAKGLSEECFEGVWNPS